MTNNLNNIEDSAEIDALIIDAILTNLPKLSNDRAHFAKNLIGEDLWLTFDNPTRRQIGGSIYRLVADRSLPLTYAKKTSCNKHTYWLS